MLRKVLAGSTSLSLPLRIRDTSSTTGAGLSGLVYNTASLVAEYRRQGQSSWTAITLVTKTLGTWVSGGFVADTGLAGDYELDLPNAAVASGAKWVRVRVYGAANMLAWEDLLELDAVDYQDAAAFGLSRIDAAISSRSSHSAADVWAVATRALTDKAGFALSAAGVQAIWDALTSALTTVGSVGKRIADFLTGDAYARIGANGAGLSAIPDEAGVTTLLSRLPAGLFTGISNFAQWLGLLAGKQTGNFTARTELRATGAGSGTFDETLHSQQAQRDNVGTAGAGLTAADDAVIAAIAALNNLSQTGAQSAAAAALAAYAAATGAQVAAVLTEVQKVPRSGATYRHHNVTSDEVADVLIEAVP